MLGIIILRGSASPVPIYELYQVENNPVCTGLMWLWQACRMWLAVPIHWC